MTEREARRLLRRANRGRWLRFVLSEPAFPARQATRALQQAAMAGDLTALRVLAGNRRRPDRRLNDAWSAIVPAELGGYLDYARDWQAGAHRNEPLSHHRSSPAHLPPRAARAATPQPVDTTHLPRLTGSTATAPATWEKTRTPPSQPVCSLG